VIPHAEGAFRRKAGRSRLEAFFGDVSHAIEGGRLEAALRLADCACRIAPDDPACILLHARLLMQLGAASEAAERLRDREEPECIAARAEALCALRSWDEAAASCQVLLRQCAVDELQNLRPLASRLCRNPESNFLGWVGVDTKVRLVGQVRTGAEVKIATRDKEWFPSITTVDQNGLDCFQFEVPTGISGPLTVCAENLKLIGSDLRWPPEFGLCGWVLMENQTLLGEVRLDWAPSLPLTLVIGPSGGESIRLPVAPSVNGSVGSPFSAPLKDLGWKNSPLEVFAILPDGTRSALIGSPVGIQPITPTPVQARPRRTIPFPSDQERESKHKVDIVIPVFAGREETLACIESALATTARHETELVVVNDASPDSELCAALARLADDGSITLLTNRTNLGFPASANKGMNLHPERDVVLLNADTELFGSWLKRLQRAAYTAGDIGTATPLGEAASIVSYPGKSARAHTPAEAEEIDRIAGKVNARKVVELPVGVGLCLYIKRACLGEVGNFDEKNFGKGYGEENDFCLRARSLGWHHVATTDLFVRHHGARSFGAAKRVLKERNRRVLNAFHPGYDAMIAGFVGADPLLNARRAIDTHRLLKEVVDPVLLLTFHLPGGVKRHVEEREAALRSAGHTVLVLKPGTSGQLDETSQDQLPHNRAPQDGDALTQNQVILTVQGSGLENLVFNLPEELPLLHALLLKLGLSGIELHHFAGLPGPVLEMVAGLGIRYDVYVHDYCWICPRLSLVGENGGYCGEPAVENCETCIRERGTVLEKSLTVMALRARSARIMEGARTVIVPSNDVRTRLARYFPALPITVMGWENPIVRAPRPLPAPPERVRVALIGAISVPKGQEILLQCVQDAIERDLDLDFVVIGFTSDDEALLATGRVFITGPYSDNEIGLLLGREQPHVAFFPSIVPETWSYALSHVLTWGLPVVAFDLGAIAERLRDDPTSELLPLWTTPAKINDALLRSARRITISEELKELAMDPTPTTTQQSKTNSEPVPQELAASVQVLTLPVGTYAFTVQGGASATPSAEGLMLPAMQVGLAPGKSEGTAEFLTNATTVDRWLAGGSDMVIVRISGGSASLLLTSLRSPSSAVLAIEVRPVDAPPRSVDPESAAGQSARTAASGELPVQIVAHVHQVGDVHFGNNLVGCLGDGLWIEAFSILSVGELPADAIEYCGVTSDGFQTPWLSNQMLCGSRGRSIPLMGYAIRLKPEAADRYECTYTGRFVSGSKHGPCANGDLCSSEVPGDALWGIELRVAPRGANNSKTPGTEMQYSTVV
jgi:GT2 family glycosyltransferase/glycosyltransferase involved in cell wall biosynthesis